VDPGYNSFYAAPSNVESPSYVDESAPTDVPLSDTQNDQGIAQGQPPEELDPSAVAIAVHVPADAQVFFNGAKTTQTGEVRSFVTPPLSPGQDFTYDVRAQWTENGRPVTRTRSITVHAGDRLALNFMTPPGNRPSAFRPPVP
jgi:uncharacterized protein (TIGR03000 family)